MTETSGKNRPSSAAVTNGAGHRLRVTMSSTDMQDQQHQQQHDSVVASATAPASLERKENFATPEEFVRRFGGRRAINKVLIANNGIAGEF